MATDRDVVRLLAIALCGLESDQGNSAAVTDHVLGDRAGTEGQAELYAAAWSFLTRLGLPELPAELLEEPA